MASSTSFSSSPPVPKRRTPIQSLVDRFNNIHLSSTRQTGFVGGFTADPEPLRTSGRNDKIDKPLPPPPSDAGDYPNNIPPFLRLDHRRDRSKSGAKRKSSQSYESKVVPPTMLMPIPMQEMPSPEQSLTMAYAQSSQFCGNPFPSLHMLQPDNNPRSSYYRHQHQISAPSIMTPSPPATPRANAHIRPSSTPSSPSSFSDSHNPSIQCQGTTKAGKQCSRVIKAPPLVSYFAPTSSEHVQRFCFQHAREVLIPTGFYSHKKGAGWVKFSDWISSYLHPDTQTALRVLMEKPPSSKDEPGYIYGYEIRDERVPSERQFKVGRAVNLAKRLDQWAKQCTSKEVILRGWWPGSIEDDDGTNGTSLLRGVIKAGEKRPWCHRLERLIHVELSDLVVHAPYLEPGFPNAKSEVSGRSSAPSTPRHSPKPSKGRLPVKPCIDCGAVHKEIFSFQRVQAGEYKDAEWEKLVQPVIAKWGRFIDEFV